MSINFFYEHTPETHTETRDNASCFSIKIDARRNHRDANIDAADPNSESRKLNVNYVFIILSRGARIADR